MEITEAERRVEEERQQLIVIKVSIFVCTPYTIRRTMYAVQYTPYGVHRTPYAIHCSVHVQSTHSMLRQCAIIITIPWQRERTSLATRALISLATYKQTSCHQITTVTNQS